MVKRTLIILIALVALPLGILSLAGIRPFVLRSDRMEPDYHNGSLIFADTGTTFDSLKEGDVIVYQGFAQELTRYQGDCRVKSDCSSATVEITPSQLVGRVIFSIPWVGNLVEIFLEHRYLAWILIVVFSVCALLPRRLFIRLLHSLSKEKEGDNP